jgi:hypothetical protein
MMDLLFPLEEELLELSRSDGDDGSVDGDGSGGGGDADGGGVWQVGWW